MNLNSKPEQRGINSPIDFSSALERTGGDESFLKGLIDIYVEDFRKMHPQLQKAIKEEDFDKIYKLGHSLLGTSATLRLKPLQEASLQLGLAGREGDLRKATKSFSIINNEFKRLQDFLIRKGWLKAASVQRNSDR